MKFEIPFSREISEKQKVLVFKELWEDRLIMNKRNIVYVIGLSAFGGIALYLGHSFATFLFFAFAIYFALNVLNVFSYHSKAKKEFYMLNEKFTELAASSDKTTIWEFNDVWLRYEDALAKAELKWEAISKAKVVEDTLLIYSQYGLPGIYFIGKDEIGDENFNQLVDFVKDQIKKRTL